MSRIPRRVAAAALMLTGALAGLPGSAAALSTPVARAAPAAARPRATWTGSTLTSTGSHPLIALAPDGAAVIAAQTGTHTILTHLSAAGVAGTPLSLPTPPDGHRRPGVGALALSAQGSTVLAFTLPGAAAAVTGLVVSGQRPGPVQTLIGAGSAPAGQQVPATATLLSTPEGVVLGAVTDDAGDLRTVRLRGTATRLALTGAPAGLGATDADAMAEDPSGDAYLAGDGANGCTTVAYGPSAAAPSTRYRTGNCASATPNVFDALAASAHGRAGLLSEDVSEAGTVPDRLLLQTGSGGSFGTATQLGSALGGPVGLGADVDGELTAEWTNCTAGLVIDGEVSLDDCAIDAAVASTATGITPAQAAGTPLAAAETGTTLRALTADRGVAIARCRAGACGLSLALAGPTAMERPHALGSGRALIALAGNHTGGLVVVWTDPRGRLFAAIADARTGRVGPDHLLSGHAVAPADVSAAVAPDGRATVTWSIAGRVYRAAASVSGA